MAHVLTALKVVPTTKCEEASLLAKELGLDRQSERYTKLLAEDVFTPLSSDEVTIWRHHCPTAYFAPPVPNGSRSLADYGFDTVPVEVMRHWKATKDRYAFDSYQIWTTERTSSNTDPLLIGVLGQKLYLLARWGLESPEQLPLKELAQSIYDGVMELLRSFGGGLDYPFQSVANATESRKRYWLANHSWFAAAARIIGKA